MILQDEPDTNHHKHVGITHYKLALETTKRALFGAGQRYELKENLYRSFPKETTRGSLELYAPEFFPEFSSVRNPNITR